MLHCPTDESFATLVFRYVKMLLDQGSVHKDWAFLLTRSMVKVPHAYFHAFSQQIFFIFFSELKIKYLV